MKPPSFEHLRPENFNKAETESVESLKKLTAFHIESFNWFVDHGIRLAIKVIARRVRRSLSLSHGLN